MLWGLYDLVFLIPLLFFITYEFMTGVLLLVAAYLGLVFLTDHNIVWNLWSWMVVSYNQLLLYALAYVAIGVLWSILKWKLFIRMLVRNVKLKFNDFNLYKEHNPESKIDFATYYSERYRNSYDHLPSSIRVEEISMSQYKLMITNWIAFWWMSLIQTFFGEWLKDFFTWVYNLFGKLYISMLKSELASLNFDK